MRRQDRQISGEEAWKIAEGCSYGILSMIDPQGLPYSVPINFWSMDGRFYFHSAREGQKTECLRYDPHVSICFVEGAVILPEQTTTKFSSAILTGLAREVTDPGKKQKALVALCRKFRVPEDHPMMKTGMKYCMPKTSVWEITVESIMGKSSF